MCRAGALLWCGCGQRPVGAAGDGPGQLRAGASLCQAGWWLQIGLSGVGGPCRPAPVSASEPSSVRSRSRRGASGSQLWE